uniref:Small EDRK-rich factor-like N-terminal domain-containing protein n=1 Tax=Hucho hucho TaxID=62062 RepID=A0A4W5KH27_9TELE
MHAPLMLNLLTDAMEAAAKKGAAANQKTAAKAALVHTCPVCQVSNPKKFKHHFESKHYKSQMVPVLVDVQA